MTEKISDHFYRHEFACPCGCGKSTVDAVTLRLCEEARALNGHRPITPTSAHRCTAHNRAVDGGTFSQHLDGRAVDLPVGNPRAVYDALCKRYPDRYGFGCYATFIHIDSRPRCARWIRD